MGFLNLSFKRGPRFTRLGETTATLGAGGVYTSPLYFSTQWLYTTGSCLADQDGYLSIQLSANPIPTITGDTTTEYYANDPLNFKVPLTLPYFRIVFTNGIVAQGSFSLIWYGAIE